MESKAGFVALLGAPNAGKSTLFNRLVGTSLAAVTPKPQTTRFTIQGILTRPEGQAIFIDTPGWIAQPRSAWHQALNNHSFKAAQAADLWLLVLAASERLGLPQAAHQLLSSQAKPLLLALTHLDKLSPAQRVRFSQEATNWAAPYAPKAVLSASLADPLDPLLEAVFSYLPPGPPLYEASEITTQPLRFFAAEIIRRHLYLNLEEEIPYSTEVEITSYRERPELDHITATIFVEKPTHKPMVIGKGGKMIKKIGTQARKEQETLIGKKVYLALHVKVAPKWRQSASRLQHWSYDLSLNLPYGKA